MSLAVPEDERARRKLLVEQCLGDGFTPPGAGAQKITALEEACRRDGRSSGFFFRWFRAEESARRIGAPSFIPDWSLYRPKPGVVAQAPGEPPAEGHRWRIRVPAARSPDIPIITVLAIGDVHDKPGRSKEHLKWAGRLADEIRPDRIVQIGDWMSLDSLSSHEARGSAKDAARPAFHEDLESAEESLDAFDRECPAEIPRDITLGNHEWRAARAANENPKESGDALIRVEQVFARYRWRTHPYGKFLYIGSVGFVHVPQTTMGRAYGGKNSENQIGNDATHSIVWGHDHRFRVKQVAKIGPNNAISLCNLGTFLPFGVVEEYSVGTLSGWSYGVVVLRIQGGMIVSAQMIDNLELARRFA